jgi:hypothetical protein
MGISSPTDIWDVAGEDEPEMDDEAGLLELPPSRRAFRMRLLLLESLFFAVLLGLDIRLGAGLEITWASELLSRFRPEGRESVGDEGGLRKDC